MAFLRELLAKASFRAAVVGLIIALALRLGLPESVQEQVGSILDYVLLALAAATTAVVGSVKGKRGAGDA